MKWIQRSMLLLFIALTFILLTIIFLPVNVNADRCQEMEKKGLLLAQQFKSTKICKASDMGVDLTDCLFKAGKTEILLVGAAGRRKDERMFGSLGSGFYILSIDPSVRVRVFVDKDFGLLVKVEGKDNLEEKGCIYNEANITLDAQVLDPDELKEIKIGTLPHLENRKDQIREVQKNLSLLGYRPGLADGMLGNQTKIAIETYKRDKHLRKDLTDEDVYMLIAQDAYLKILDELKRLTGSIEKLKPLPEQEE
jgi:hypothetical protein